MHAQHFHTAIYAIAYSVKVRRRSSLYYIVYSAQARIQEFLSGVGGVKVSHTKKALTTFFFVLRLFYRSQMVNLNFKETFYHFSRFRRGPTIFQGVGVQLFQGGGGSNCLFPIETHVTCDFPGGPDPLSPPPPLNPHLASYYLEGVVVIYVTFTISRF